MGAEYKGPPDVYYICYFLQNAGLVTQSQRKIRFVWHCILHWQVDRVLSVPQNLCQLLFFFSCSRIFLGMEVNKSLISGENYKQEKKTCFSHFKCCFVYPFPFIRLLVVFHEQYSYASKLQGSQADCDTSPPFPLLSLLEEFFLTTIRIATLSGRKLILLHPLLCA